MFWKKNNNLRNLSMMPGSRHKETKFVSKHGDRASVVKDTRGGETKYWALVKPQGARTIATTFPKREKAVAFIKRLKRRS